MHCGGIFHYFLGATGAFYLYSPLVCSTDLAGMILFFILGVVLGSSIKLFFRTFKIFMPLKDSTLETLSKLSKVKQITENLPGAIYRYYQPSHSKVGFGRIDYMTQGLFDLYGITSEQAIEDPTYLYSLIHPDDLSEFDASVDLYAQLGSRWSHQWRIVTPGGEIKWIEGNATVNEIQPDGTRVWDGVLKDITESKLLVIERERLKELERHAQIEAERASRSLDEFLSVISHELKTPLTPILGWVSLLLKNTQKMPEVDEKTFVRGLMVIQRQVEKQIGLIEELLDASRIVCDKIPINLNRFDFSVLVRDAVEFTKDTLAQESQDKKIVSLTVGQGDFTCVGDFARLKQVVCQLLSNAVKFTPASGRIDIFLDNQEGLICLDVADTGSGISPDFLPTCFEFFSHESCTDTRSTGGLGLGLPIVRHLVELHGGTITASSPGKGKGSTFTVKLPKQPSSDAPVKCLLH
jgi:signal transduction histidine kinase